ncbi:MAG TPA: pitrilysin family protein [Pyrinomonadaceae bacterium]|nr:pitrilysin family protein [Pyrinomonadaceae bacterium]
MSRTEPQTEDFRRRPPEPLSPRTLNLPAAEEVALSNGLRVLLVESRRLPLVSFRLAFPTGDAHDPADRPGLTDLLTGMLNEGTETRTSRQIADEVARIGATLTAGASADFTTVAATALSGFTDQILELMADIALRPSFPEDELELTKQNTLQNLIAQRGQPSFLANERVSKVIFGEHPYSVVAPTPESIEAATREELIDFHRAAFIPNNAVLVAGGDFTRDEMLRRLEELFGAWRTGEPVRRESPAPPELMGRTLHLVDRPGSAQSNIVIANRGIVRTDPDYFPALVMHTILGGNASSRLFMNLREEKGYTYGAYTNLDARREAGSFRATAEVRTPVTGDSLREFFGEFERIRGELVAEKELADAKSYLSGVFPIRLETLDGFIDQLVQIRMHALPDDYLHTYRERVQSVTREEVRGVAQKLVTPGQAAVVIVGDASAVRAQAESFAESVELYDSSGRRKNQGDEKGMERQTTAAQRADAGADSLLGVWNLDVQTPFGQHPATLTLQRDADGTATGDVTSRLGRVELSGVSLSAEGFEASAAHNFQGREYTARVSGRLEGEQLAGTIKVNLPIAPPLKFTGTRQQ